MPEEKYHVGKEIQNQLVRELGSKLASTIENKLVSENIHLYQASVNDVTNIIMSVEKHLMDVVGYRQRKRVNNSLKLIKPMDELVKLKSLPKSDQNQRREVELLIEIGRLESLINRYESALKSIKEAIQITDFINYPEKKAEAIVYLGNTYEHMREVEKAEEAYNKALALARKGGYSFTEVRALRGLGGLDWKFGVKGKEIDYLETGLKIARERKVFGMVGEILNLLAMIEAEKGDFKASRVHYLQAIDFIKNNPRESSLAMIYNNLGDSYLQEKNAEKAIKYFDLCREHALQVKDESWEAWSYLNTAEALTLLDDADGCIEACKKALPIFEFLKDNYPTMSTYRNMAIGYSMKGEWDKVDECLSKARELLEELKMPFHSAYFDYTAGKIEAIRGDTVKAKELFESAKQKFSEIETPTYVKKVEEAMRGL